MSLVEILKSIVCALKKLGKQTKTTSTTINIHIDNIVVQVNNEDVNVYNNQK